MSRLSAVESVEIAPSTTPGNFLLSWNAVAGRTYVVEAGRTLTSWDEVTRVTAVTSRVNSLEVALGGDRTFWRVIEIGGSPAVSSIQAAYTLTGDQAAAVLSLTTAPEPPLGSVEFLADGVLLGDAQPGLDDTWTFTVVAGDDPQVASLQARVTGADGTQTSTPPTRFLLADPSRFVAAGPGGERLYGQLIGVDALGRLAAFYYYPEGVSDGLRQSGAFFAFPEDAAVISGSGADTELVFTDGAFHRGPQDSNPITPLSGDGEPGSPAPLRLSEITPQEVNESFGRAPNEPIDLQFGGASVKWEEGALGEDGWNGLKVRLPIGDFLLPGTQLVTEVVIGPGNRVDSLLVTYFGSWQPLPEGPVFEVPESDPLRVYLDYKGVVTARGTVIAQLGNGGSLRGTASWVPPFFEISLEGRKVVVPALEALRGVLPEDGANVVSAAVANGSSAALDDAETALRGFQATLSQMATANESQAPAGGAASAPVPSPESAAAASALAAWAARMGSWAVDRTGQNLTEVELTNLVEAIANAVKAARASEDLNFIGGVWSSVVIIDANKAVAGTGQNESTLSAVTSSALVELIVIRERLVDQPLSEDLEVLANHKLPGPGPVEEIVTNSIRPREALAERNGGGGGFFAQSGDPAREAAVAEKELQRKMNAIYARLGLRPDGSVIVPNALSSLPLFEKLLVLTTLADGFEGLVRLHPGSTLDSPMALGFKVAFESVSPEVEAVLFPEVNAARVSGELARMQSVLQQLTIYSLAYRRLTGDALALPPDLFDLMEASVAALKTAVLQSRPRKRQAMVSHHLSMLHGLMEISDSPATGAFVALLLDDLSQSSDQLRALVAGSPDCDELLQAIKANSLIPFSGLRENDHPLADGAVNQIDCTGRYESVSVAGGKFHTLQLNRAGQYVLGRMQEHENRRPTRSWEFEGLMLGDETASAVDFSCLRYRGSSIDSMILHVETTANGIQITTTPKPTGEAVTFTKRNGRAFYSEQFEPRMTGEVGAVFAAAVRAPLHEEQLVEVAAHVKDLQFAMLEWDRFRNVTQNAVQRGLVDVIDSACTRLINSVSSAQLPVVRQFVRQRLSAYSDSAKPGSTPADVLGDRLQLMAAGHTSQWTRLLILFRDRGLLVDPGKEGDSVLESCGALLLGESLPGQGAPLFTYAVKINSSTFPSPIPVSLGWVTFEITRSGGGSDTETFYLAGDFAQIGGGLPLGKIAAFLDDLPSGGTGSDTVTVTSHVRYTEAELSGPMFFGSFGASAPTFGIGSQRSDPNNPDVVDGLVFAASAGVGGFTLAGPLGVNKPPLILPLEIFSTSQKFSLGVEAEVGVGGVVSASAFDGEVDIFSARLEPLKGSPRREFDLNTETAFANNSSVVSDCGWSQLRQFIADYRAIFDDPMAKVTLIGLTDTTGSDADNLILSQNRNASVLAAMTRILGHAPGSAQSPLRILSLGEQPARSDLPLPAGLNATETAMLIQMQHPTQLGTLPENNPQSVPGWRVVRVLLNNTIFFDLNSL